MARTDWEDHPTAYRARVTITATDPVSKDLLREDAFYGPYGTKGGAKGQATSRARQAGYYARRDSWVIRGKKITVEDWKVEGVVEQLVGYGKWEVIK